MSVTIEISERDGEYTAVDSESGATGIGNTKAMALAAIAVRLGAEEGRADEDSRSELTSLAERTRRRFEEADVDESDVEDAIAWARSE